MARPCCRWSRQALPAFPPGVQVLPLKPALTRHTAVVHRPLAALDGATRNLLQTLAQFRQA